MEKRERYVNPFKLETPSEHEELAERLRKAHTSNEVAQAVQVIKQYVIDHRKEKENPYEEDVRLFLKYCDNILRDGMNNGDAFLRSLDLLVKDGALN